MQLKPKYKNTEIGIIPQDWEVKTLGEILTFGSGRDYKSLSLGEIPVYGTGGIMTYVNDYLYDGESVGIGRKGTIDKPVFLRGKFWTVDTLFYTHQFVNSNPEFIYYKFCLIKWKEYNEASGVPSLNKGTLEKIKISIPTLAEQTAIAAALSDADALISSLEMLIDKKRNIKQGAMQKLLNYDSFDLYDENDLNNEEKKVILQNQKKHNTEKWEVKKLGEIAEVNMGQSPLSAYYNSKGIGLPLVQGNADVKNRKTIIRFYTSMITKKGKAGDIIMSVRAPVGDISKAIFDCCLGRGVCSISFDNEYLYHYLIYFEKSWAKLSTGSTFDSVNSKQVKELEIPIPKSKEEQVRIAGILSDMDVALGILEEKLEKYKDIKMGMMQNLLTGKICLV